MKVLPIAPAQRISIFSILAIFLTTVYALAFGALYIPVDGAGYAVVDVAILIFVFTVPTAIVFASLAGRRRGFNRVIAFACGGVLLAPFGIALVLSVVDAFQR